TRYQYDNLNRLTNLTHTASNGALLASYSYQLHPTGRRTNAVEILATDDSQTPWMTNTIAWSYDAMYRLTNEVTVSTSSAVAHSAAYEYDLAGNRWKRTSGTETTTYVHDDNDQLRSEVTGSSTTSYDYNRNGSLTNKTDGTGTISYAYNLANKLSSVTAGSTTHFEYNDQGIRVRSIAGYSTNYFLIDANNHTGYQQVLEEFTAASTSRTLTRSYVIGDDVLGQCGGEQTDEPRWLLYDGHGSTRQLVHGEASIQQHYNFDAYGRSLGTDLAQQTSDTSLLYCGEQFDTALQMYNLRARYYNPNNGRFNQRDTFGGNNFDPQSLHKYAYTNCDPVNGTDPNGCFTLVENLAAITILTIIVSAVVVALKAFPMPGARSRVVFPPTGGPPIHLSPGPNNSAWLAALLAVMSIVLTEAVRQSGQTEQPQPNPEPDAQGVVLQSGTAQAGEEENLKDIYFHYSQDPPASFSKGLDPPAWVTDIKYSGLDSENAMFGFGIPPPKYEYFFRIDRWTMLDPPDPSTPRRWTQYRVIRPTGAGSLVGWREVAQTHKGRQQ
ncbi:MAG TPA: RHS repeat-associated core domain-containing protein, partial [Clostridia bacterium]|nr:RHS repeat-associated core domain-containing protein [Clostridia bacterium]